MRYQIRPLAPERGPTPGAERKGGSFRTTYATTLRDLEYEAERLGATLVVIQVDADERWIRQDGMLYARAVVDSPAVRVSFESRHGPLSYATDRYLNWVDNLRAIALSLQALRAVDRYGVSSSGQQYRGWLAIEAAPSTMSRVEAADYLCRWAGLGSQVDMLRGGGVMAAYRVAAKRLHPDLGGSEDAMARLNIARDVLLAGASS